MEWPWSGFKTRQDGSILAEIWTSVIGAGGGN
jgi:hypothetical protein